MAIAYFTISGIRCASCVANIEKGLKKKGGILGSSVSLVSSKAMIEYDEHILGIGDIEKIIKQLGYTSKVIEESGISDIKKEEQSQATAIKALFKKLVTAISFTIPLVVLAMTTMHMELSFTLTLAFALFQLCCVLPLLYLSKERFIHGVKALYALYPNMDSLITLGVGASFLYSLYQTGCIFIGNITQYQQLYFESAGSILTLVLLGEYLEKKAKWKASQTLHQLVNLSPTTATVIGDDGNTSIVALAMMKQGDIVLVQQGMSIPVDGIIMKGEGMINEAMLTGESMPIYKQVGETVFAGTLVIEGSYHVKMLHAPSESILYKLIIAVEKAQQTKAPIAQLADIASRYFVPFVLCVAFLAGLTWYALGASFSFSFGIIVTTLIIACPCAMGLATPLSLIIAMGRATQQGVVIKTGQALEESSRITTLFIDKTGTLTLGQPSVQFTHLLGYEKVQSIKEYIAPIVHYSSHPITRSLEIYCQDIKTPYTVEHFDYQVGKGIIARIKDAHSGNALYTPTYILAIGSEIFMKERGIYPKAAEVQELIRTYCENLYKQGASPLYIAKDKEIIAILGLKDTVREDAKQTIHLLKEQGIQCIMLSGDVPQTAKAIANEVGIDTIYAGLLPEEKASVLEEYKAKGDIVMMVGDGINDAVALSIAHVGVAMGKGVDIAQEASDIVLLSDTLSSLYKTIMLSRATIRNIKQNLFWAFFYNTMSLPIASGLLYTLSGLVLTPMFASMAMVFSSLSVVGNALRLQYTKEF